VRSLSAAVLGAILAVLSFPPVGWGWLIVPGIALFLWALRRGGLAHGAVFGVIFFSGLIWWIGELGLIAVVPLVVSQAAYLAVFGHLLGRARGSTPGRWWMAAVGGWALMELVRLRFPVGGFEWGMAGYPAGEYRFLRAATQWVGTSGWTVSVVAVAAGVVVALETRRRLHPLMLGPLAALLALGLLGAVYPPLPDGPELRVAVVQGSTPCPFVHCDDERLLTLAQHLALTATIAPASVDLVVWSEGSTGGFDADPLLDPQVAEAIGALARRLQAFLLAGGDRPVSAREWINANVLFSPEGEILGEYRKRHPVPFGEYIPARPLFAWIPELRAVPRDMIRGKGPVIFDLGSGSIGSVISFEGSFARYGRDAVKSGAQVLVVATNEGSYGHTPASDQLIAMTRMRSAELGVDVIHAAVTGKSTIITQAGVVGPTTELAEQAVLTGVVRLRTAGPTVYTVLGDWLQMLAVLLLPFGVRKSRLAVVFDAKAGGVDRLA
jgi:apolipoprotein N-acyltransferase